MLKFKQFISEIKMRAISQKPSQWLTGDEELLEKMRDMRDQGMSYRQIAESLGYKSHSTVSRILK